VVCLWIEVNAAAEVQPDAALMSAEIPAEGEMLLF
jgi:hypothetical protein